MAENDDFGPLAPRPKNWNEVFAITGELRDISIEEIDRGRVDWEYDFDSKDMRPCGRKSCEQKHKHGWLVALKGQRFVHIGNDCAVKYAHVDQWKSNVGTYLARVAAESRTTALLETRDEAQRKQFWLDNTPEIKAAIALHDSFAQQAHGPLLTELERRADRGITSIERDVKLSGEELEARRSMNSGNIRADGTTVTSYVASVEKRVVGEIAGLDCFRPSGNPKELHRHLQRLVSTLLSWSPAEDDQDAARSLVRATRDLAPLSNQLNSSLVSTARFFSEVNLRTLMKLPTVQSQGIVSIERIAPETIRIERRVHWGKAA